MFFWSYSNSTQEPRYGMIFERKVWADSFVKNTPGVTGFVGAGSKPIPLSQPEVDRILHTGASTAERARTLVEFILGEQVKVTSGPLSDFDGEIVDVNPDQQKLKVLVDIFERQVPVELGFDQVKKID